MKEFTYSEARQRFATLLERARREGAVRIRRRDGQVFVLRPDAPRGSPLDVPSVGVAISRAELVAAVREGRDRAPGTPRRRRRAR
jgi:antitoxin (DNA-binding transcriptional repressor) of toxin-antitoxin stability system